MKYQNPPPQDGRAAGRSAFDGDAEELRRTGEWAIVRQYPGNKNASARRCANDIRAGRYAAFRPQGHWEAQSALETENGIRVSNVYARYIGP